MSGHSKWSTIKHKKGKLDAQRGKIFTKFSREITVAAREGGGDPAGNSNLRRILDDAKAVNMPNENITRAIKKGTGEIEGAHYEAQNYEGYGPCGVAVIIETLSDNKNRTVADLRHVFSKAGGNLAEGGAVAWMFDHRGVLRFDTKLSEDALLEGLLDYSIDDITVSDGHAMVTCALHDLDVVKKAIQDMKQTVESAKPEWVANNSVTVDDTNMEAVCKFLDTLDDLDDVQNVYANIKD